MKKKLSLLIFTVLMLCLNTILQAQQKPETINSFSKKSKPYAIMEGIKDSVIDKSIFMKVERLTCSDNKYKIISFSMSLLLKNGELHQVLSNSNAITPEMKKYISEKELEGRIWIEDIKSKTPEGNLIALPAIAFKIH